MLSKKRWLGVLLVAIAACGVGAGFIWHKVSLRPFPDEVRISGILPAFSKEELAFGSPLIVEGTVSEVLPAQWNTRTGQEPPTIGPADAIYHDVAINVKRVLKGGPTNNRISVRVYEGNVPQGKTIKVVQSEGQPKFSAGEQVILFLDYDDSPYNREQSRDYYVTKGLLQGKWTVENGYASNSLESSPVEELIKIIEKHA